MENALKHLPVSIWKSGAQRERDPLQEQEAGSGSDLLSNRELAVGLGSGSSLVAFHTHPIRTPKLCTSLSPSAHGQGIGLSQLNWGQRVVGKTELMGLLRALSACAWGQEWDGSISGGKLKGHLGEQKMHCVI